MLSARANSMLSPILVHAGVWFPAMLGTALAAGHADHHHTVADLVLEVALLLVMAALLIHVILTVVAILRERDLSIPGDGRFASEDAAPQGPTLAALDASSERPPSKPFLGAKK
jgi:hypothetical protein